MNEYLYSYADEPVTLLQPLAGCEARISHGNFFEKLLCEFDRRMCGHDLQLFLTWNRRRLQITGPRVVAIVVGDERCLVPPDTGKVLAVFRTGTQALNASELVRPGVGFSERVLDWGRFALKASSRLLRWLQGTAQLCVPDNVFPIPLTPSHGDTGIPSVPLAARRWDVGFLGSVGPTRSWAGRRFPLAPKSAARLAMLRGLRSLQQQAPQLAVSVGCDLQPEWPPLVSPEAYAGTLRNTKISLCPRGNFSETFRLAESAREGCVIITDPLPKEWYFDGHPFIEIRNWRDLPALAASLTTDPARMNELAAKAKDWWHSHLSPEAVAAYMAQQLTQLLDQSPPQA